MVACRISHTISYPSFYLEYPPYLIMAPYTLKNVEFIDMEIHLLPRQLPIQRSIRNHHRSR